METAKAVIRTSVVLVSCPACHHQMSADGMDSVRCTNSDCSHFEKIWTVETPTFDVNLRGL